MDQQQLYIILTNLSLLVAGWLVSNAFYRLFLHPLSPIPGPKLAALTYWYEFYYDVIKPGQYVFKIKDLHKQYGPIIRVNPREVHVNDVNFLDSIYPISNKRKRGKDVFQLRNMNLPFSTAGARDHELHRKRREALNPFFSQQSVLWLESLITAKVSQLCRYLDVALKSQDSKVMNLSDLYYALARDVVFQYSFGRDCDFLGDLEQASRMRKNLTKMLLGVKFKANLPFLFKCIDYLPSFIRQSLAPPGAQDMKELRNKIGSEINQIIAGRDQDNNMHKRSILRDLSDHQELQAPEDLPVRLAQEGTFLVMAGTESTAKVLCIAHFYMLRNPHIMSNLRQELNTTEQHLPLSQLMRLPYLNAVINEANRLAFGLTGRVARVAPEETLQYEEYVIPPGTPVSMTTLCIHTSEAVFPEPWEFRPERWLGQQGLHLQKYQYGFGRGARRCLGMHLAMAELLICLSAVAKYDMSLFETNYDDVVFKHDYQVAHPKLDSKGVRAKLLGRHNLEKPTSD